MTSKYLISVATYKRPEGIQRLLESLYRAISDRDDVDVVVVDNDENGSAQEIVNSHPLGARYKVEKEPGIASARNRGLMCFEESYFAIIFIDDDEWVEPDWFTNLIEFTENSNADVVQGPVVTVLPEDSPRWVRTGGFYQRKTRLTGEVLESAATNNTLLTRQAWLNAGSPKFDAAFSSTGGSDWDLFWGIRKSGSKIVYCDNAIVSEDVPANRMTKQWIQQRYVRNGIVGVRVCQKHNDPILPYLLKAAAIGMIGTFQMALEFVTRQGPQAKSLSRVLISWGKFSGFFGKRIHEYKRNSS